MTDTQAATLWALLVAILAAEVVQVIIATIGFSRALISIFRRKGGGSKK